MLKKLILVLLVGFVSLSLVGLWLAYRFPATPLGDSGSSGSQANRVYTAEQVARHNTADDCWLIIRNNVYDVSSFIGQHPGGKAVITERCGQEMTSIFTAIHSNQAWDLLNSYLIGTLQSV